MDGSVLAVLGLGVACLGGGIGSCLGVGKAGLAAAGVTAEKPDVFGKALVLEALPGTQGVYGFLVAFVILLQTGILGGEMKEITNVQGWQIFFGCIPVAVTGFFSGVYQGKVSVAGMNMIAKDSSSGGKAMVLSAMVETFAVLGFLISVLLIFRLQLG